MRGAKNNYKDDSNHLLNKFNHFTSYSHPKLMKQCGLLASRIRRISYLIVRSKSAVKNYRLNLRAKMNKATMPIPAAIHGRKLKERPTDWLVEETGVGGTAVEI